MVSIRFILLLALAAPSGCVSLHVTRPVRVTVMYAETFKPVPDVSVETHYADFCTLNEPRNRMARTDKNGEAIIPISWATGWIASSLNVGGYGESFSEPFSSVHISSDVIVGEKYALKLEPSSWLAYYKQRRFFATAGKLPERARGADARIK